MTNSFLKTTMRLTCCLGFVIFLLTSVNAVEPHVFRSGLVLPQCHNYGRTAGYTDQLAYLLNNGKLQHPIIDQAAFANSDGQQVRWAEIKASDDGKFRGRPMGSGYLYLIFTSAKEQQALLHITNNSMVYVNGEPRGGDIYADGFIYLPVKLKKGLNEFYVRGGRFSAWSGISAELVFDATPVFVNVKDPTLPIIVPGRDNTDKMGAVVVVNNTDNWQKELQIKCTLAGKEKTAAVPAIAPMSFRKVRFDMDASAITTKGKHSATLQLIDKNKSVHSSTLEIESVNEGEDYSETFISRIDGSVQYYAVSPQAAGDPKTPALFLSVHGAGVEAIGQARAYKSKPEGVLVAPTNRRPRGFNWEDWGRIDALEVLDLAKKQFAPDPQRIYLTGHSMGGHGTWFLGATYAGQWAAIAPCAGYPTLAAYGSADGQIPAEGRNDMENLLLQASNPSNVLELAGNYNAGGVYIFHGDSDRTVPVRFAREMHQLLSKTSKDLNYYEYPGGSHWFGDESVDWKPLFDYFGWHTIPANRTVHSINFTTANPAISSRHYWVTIHQQQQAFKYSRITLSRSKDLKTISGSTENIALLAFDTEGLQSGDPMKITLDGQEIACSVKPANDTVYLRRTSSGWQVAGAPDDKGKGVVRNGTFKEPFDHRMVYVYGTSGNRDENAWAFAKARYDAETWYYRGNGAVDIVSDKDFRPENYPDRGIVIYGNASTNTAWKVMLGNCPIQVTRGKVQVGDQSYTGANLGTYFVWPRADSKIASIAVVTGSGIEGMRAADANQYFAGGSGFPDYMIFSSQIMIQGTGGIVEAGFYDNNWSLQNAQRVTKQ